VNFRTVAIAGLAALAGCQLHSEKPTDEIVVAGSYKSVADCFYLAIRGEGFWKKDDLDSQNMTVVTMGNVQFDMGKVEFIGTSATITTVRFLIPHPGKLEPKIRACSQA
jgi:hypothetical protein